MNKEKLQQLKKVIQDAVPDIVSQIVGCKALDYDNNEWLMVGIRFGWWWRISSENDFERDSSKFKEILGRPITLADVLIAIKKKAKIIGWIEILKIVKEHTHVIGNEGYLYYFLIENWDLTKNLDNQPPEVHELLYKLLVK